MTANQPGSLFDSSGDHPASELQIALDRQEANLTVLERLLADERQALLDPESHDLLGLLQDIEEVLARIGRLEGHRHRLEARMGIGSGVFYFPPARPVAVEQDVHWPGARLLESRHRILGLIARIAEHGEANSLLVEGLARMGKVRLERHFSLETPETPGPSNGLRQGGRCNSAEACDVSA